MKSAVENLQLLYFTIKWNKQANGIEKSHCKTSRALTAVCTVAYCIGKLQPEHQLHVITTAVAHTGQSDHSRRQPTDGHIFCVSALNMVRSQHTDADTGMSHPNNVMNRNQNEPTTLQQQLSVRLKSMNLKWVV